MVWTSTQAEQRVLCFGAFDTSELARKLAQPGSRFHADWRKLAPQDKPQWSFECPKALATAVCDNCVLVAMPTKIQALDLDGGRALWTQALPAAPVPWGLAVDRRGRVIVTLDDGRVLCFGPDEDVPRDASIAMARYVEP